MEFQDITTQQSPHILRSTVIRNDSKLPPGIFRVSVPPLTESKNAGEVIKVKEEYYLLHEDVSTGETQIVGELLSVDQP